MSISAALFGCRTQSPDNEAVVGDMQRPYTSIMTFSHEIHKQSLDKIGFDCTVCHPMNIDIKDKEDIEIEELIKASEQSFFPGKETCHFCHYNPQSGTLHQTGAVYVI